MGIPRRLVVWRPRASNPSINRPFLPIRATRDANVSPSVGYHRTGIRRRDVLGRERKNTRRKPCSYRSCGGWDAEREGFEPSRELPPYSISSAAPSAARPSLRRSIQHPIRHSGRKWWRGLIGPTHIVYELDRKRVGGPSRRFGPFARRQSRSESARFAPSAARSHGCSVSRSPSA